MRSVLSSLTISETAVARRSAIDFHAVDFTAFDTRILEDVRSNLGQQNTDALLGLLVYELEERFGPTSNENAERLGYEAHVMVSAAGSLGFVGFSDLCRAAEEACRNSQDLTPLRIRLVKGRNEVIRQIETLRGIA